MCRPQTGHQCFLFFQYFEFYPHEMPALLLDDGLSFIISIKLLHISNALNKGSNKHLAMSFFSYSSSSNSRTCNWLPRKVDSLARVDWLSCFFLSCPNISFSFLNFFILRDNRIFSGVGWLVYRCGSFFLLLNKEYNEFTPPRYATNANRCGLSFISRLTDDKSWILLSINVYALLCIVRCKPTAVIDWSWVMTLLLNIPALSDMYTLCNTWLLDIVLCQELSLPCTAFRRALPPMSVRFNDIPMSIFRSDLLVDNDSAILVTPISPNFPPGEWLIR